jgi:sugar O-acyltransferase (sialic acid O-acetyltransferase NeuD family)
MNKQRVVVIGAGAQAKYVLEIFGLSESAEVVGLIDLAPSAGSSAAARLGVPILGGPGAIETLAGGEIDGAIVCCSSSARKASLSELVDRMGIPLVDAIHPRAVLATSASFHGGGLIINAGVVLEPFVRVGRGVTIHANVVVEHDVRLDDYANLGPGVNVAGSVTIGEGAIVATGASLIPEVTIGRRAVVGAGAVVLEDVPEGMLAVGVPARILRAVTES